jgi:MOSC domain-containing protein YiiM
VDITGTIRTGDEITVLERPAGAPTIREVFAIKYRISVK